MSILSLERPSGLQAHSGATSSHSMLSLRRKPRASGKIGSCHNGTCRMHKVLLTAVTNRKQSSKEVTLHASLCKTMKWPFNQVYAFLNPAISTSVDGDKTPRDLSGSPETVICSDKFCKFCTSFCR